MEKAFADLFTMLDRNKNGVIDEAEQEKATKKIHSMTPPKARWTWSVMDTDGDGKISEREFQEGMQAICDIVGEEQLLDSILRAWTDHPLALEREKADIEAELAAAAQIKTNTCGGITIYLYATTQDGIVDEAMRTVAIRNALDAPIEVTLVLNGSGVEFPLGAEPLLVVPCGLTKFGVCMRRPVPFEGRYTWSYRWRWSFPALARLPDPPPQSDGLHVDASFPTEWASVSSGNESEPLLLGANEIVCWARAPQVLGTGTKLFEGKIEPGDIFQGSLADCWLMSSIAAVAEFPEAIRALFPWGEAGKE